MMRILILCLLSVTLLFCGCKPSISYSCLNRMIHDTYRRDFNILYGDEVFF